MKKEEEDLILIIVIGIIGALIFGPFVLIDSIYYSVVGESAGFYFWADIKADDPNWTYNIALTYGYGILITTIDIILIIAFLSSKRIRGYFFRYMFIAHRYRKKVKELDAEFYNNYNTPIPLHKTLKEKKVLRKQVKKSFPKKSVTNEEKASLISGDYIICHHCNWENTYDREFCDMCETKLKLDNVIYDFEKRIQIKQDSVSYIREGTRNSNGRKIYTCPVCEWSYIDYTIDFCNQCGEDLHKYDIAKSEYRLKKKQDRYETSLINDVSKILSKKALLSKKKKEKRKEYLQRALSSQKNDKLKGFTRHISNKVRTEVWNRDNGLCVICGSQKNLEFDHIIPFSKGGRSVADNIQF